MKILPDPVSFIWDKGNIDKNLKKHGIANKEAENIFENKPIFISKDINHSLKNEKRFQALGKTDNDRLLFISFTVRSDKVRIISARDMSKKEGRVYEDKTKTNS